MGSLFKTRLTSSRLCKCTSRPLAEQLQLDWKACLDNEMTPVKLLRHHPLKYFANLNVHVSKSEFALSWLKRHHLNPSIIPSLLRQYPDGNMSIPINMLIISNNVFGVLDNGEVIVWNQNGVFYTHDVIPCVKKVTHIFERKILGHVYAIRSRDHLVVISSGNPINEFFLSQLSGREIQCLYNSGDEIFAKLDDNSLLIASISPDEKIPERLLDQRIQSVCILRDNIYLVLLENGELVGWGKGMNEWDFPICRNNMMPKKILSMTTNFYHNIVSLVLEDGCTILQSGYLRPGADSPSKLLLKLRDRVRRINSAEYTHVAWLDNGGIHVWGELYGGEVPIIPKDTGIRSIHHTTSAIALLLENERLLVLGNPDRGGRLPALLENRKVLDVVSTQASFLALLDDHTIINWGGEASGLSMPSQLVGCRVKTIFSNQCCFLALLENESLYCWGRVCGPQGKKIIIPKDHRIKNVIPIKGSFIIQLDNDALILLKASREKKDGEFEMMQYQLPLPKGRRLAVMDREM